MKNKMFLLMMLVVLITICFASAEEVEVTKTVNVDITNTSVIIGLDGTTNTYTLIPSSNSFQHIFSVECNESCINTSCFNQTTFNFSSNISSLFDDYLGENFYNNLTNILLVIDENQEALMNDSYAKQENIIERVRSTVSSKCDYNLLMQNISNSLVPKQAEIDAVENERDACRTSLQSCTINKGNSDGDLEDLKKESKNKTWIIIALFALLLFMAYLQFGGQGPGFIQKLKWKKGGNPSALRSSSLVKRPQSETDKLFDDFERDLK